MKKDITEIECFRCKEVKPVSEYRVIRVKKTGYSASCKKCLTYKPPLGDLTLIPKTCARCKEVKTCADFYKSNTKYDGLKSSCKTCHGKYEKEYDEKHKDKHNSKMQDYRKRNPAKIKEISKRSYYKDHKKTLEKEQTPERKDQKKKAKKVLLEKNPTYFKDYVKSKRATDPQYRLGTSLRSRVNSALKGKAKKSAKTMELVGCTMDFLKEYLEARFLPTMTWDNYGSLWHLDHIKPCSKYDLTDITQQQLCFHYTNLQPLFALTTIIDGVEYIGNLEKNAKDISEFFRPVDTQL